VTRECPLPAHLAVLTFATLTEDVVLQEGTFEPLGSNVSIEVDVRVVESGQGGLGAPGRRCHAARDFPKVLCEKLRSYGISASDAETEIALA
jgi:hypothetical protein